MYCLDASFLIDLMRGDPKAGAKAAAIAEAGEGSEVAAPALAEVLLGAHRGRAADLRRALEFVANLKVGDTDRVVAMEAARLGAELRSKGIAMPMPDLLIAATAKIRGQVLLTRDAGFSRVPGLAVESY